MCRRQSLQSLWKQQFYSLSVQELCWSKVQIGMNLPCTCPFCSLIRCFFLLLRKLQVFTPRKLRFIHRSAQCEQPKDEGYLHRITTGTPKQYIILNQTKQERGYKGSGAVRQVPDPLSKSWRAARIAPTADTEQTCRERSSPSDPPAQLVANCSVIPLLRITWHG